MPKYRYVFPNLHNVWLTPAVFTAFVLYIVEKRRGVGEGVMHISPTLEPDAGVEPA